MYAISKSLSSYRILVPRLYHKRLRDLSLAAASSSALFREHNIIHSNMSVSYKPV